MRQLSCTKPGTLAWLDVDPPRIEDAEDALIRPVAVARCEIDPVLIAAGPTGPPFAIGHEAVAEVVEAGSAVTAAVGDLVVPSFQLCCGRCPTCEAGWTARCESYPVLSDYGMASMSGVEHGGMLADLVRVPHANAMLAALPRGIDPVVAASAADNIADGYRAVAPHLARRPRAPVLVVCHGNRSIALYAAHAAVALGAAEVVFESDDPATLEIAARVGATPVLTDLSRRNGRWPIVVDCGVDPAGIRHAIASAAPGGVVQSVSYYPEASVGLPLGKMYTLGVELSIGRVHSATVAREILRLMGEGRLRPEVVPTTVIPWEEAAGRYLEPACKLVVVR